MKILFALASPEYLRFYDGTIEELARRGHDVVVAASTVREGKPVRFDRIAGLEGVTVTDVIPRREDMWTPLVAAIRGTMDFVRYLHPSLAHTPALRARVKRQALPWVLSVLDRVETWPPTTVQRRMARLARLEEAVPVAREPTAFLRMLRPDVLLVSPLVELASEQVDIVRSAKALGIRVGALVASWDNLTNKGDLRVETDRVMVWNEAQKREAIELHRVAGERVVVTGAPTFDRWFDRAPTVERSRFCREVGLPSDAPFVLYTGSSIFIARADVEIPFIRRWVSALRESGDPVVRELNVLVRPHPYNGRAWSPDALTDLGNVAVWPRGGYDPVDDTNRAGFFDSMFHAEAVVGVNTSAMIESAIVGRPVFSILAPEFSRAQDGTRHFQHLLPENGGFLHVAPSLGEHTRQLGAVLRDPGARAGLARFVNSFIRPLGMTRPATPLLADAIEALGTVPVSAVSRTTWDRVVSLSLLPAALIARWCPPESLRKKRTARAGRASRPNLGGAGRLLRRSLSSSWRRTVGASGEGR